MAQGFQVSIKGVAELKKKLEAVSQDMQLKGGRASLRKAANVIADQLRKNAAQLDDPLTAANIEKNVTVRFSPKAFQASGLLKFRVGIMGGAGGNKTSDELSGLPGQDTSHWRHKEFGTEKMPAQPFMRKTLPEVADAVVTEFIQQYSTVLDRTIKKL